MYRSEIRELVFQQLFLSGFYQASEQQDQNLLFLEDNTLLREELEIPKNGELSDAEKVDLMLRSKAVSEKLTELDAKINEVAEGWKTNRMGRVELAIIRLALYEMLFDDDVPTGVAINEAVELSKKYGGNDSPSFVNAILGKLSKGLTEG